MVEKWVVVWTKPDGTVGQSEPVTTDKEAWNWVERMRCWWPERKYRVEKVYLKGEQVRDLAAPYRTT